MSAINTISSVTTLSWSGNAAKTYGAPYFPSLEEKQQRADEERSRDLTRRAIRAFETASDWFNLADRDDPEVPDAIAHVATLLKVSDKDDVGIKAIRQGLSKTRSILRQNTDDFKSLRTEMITLLGQWHKAQKRVLRYSAAEIRGAIIEHYKELGREGAIITQAATSAISEHLALDYDEIRKNKAKTRREAEKARLTYGFRWNGAELLGGKYRITPFVYQGLRSKEHFWMAHFLSLTPSLRSGNYRSGNSKDLVGGDECDSKLLGLDDGWIDINKELIGLLKQDIDATFSSWDHLRQEILDRNLPLPHIAVAHVDDAGRVHNPHLAWFLPKNQGIRTDVQAFLPPQKLYKAVQRGICNEMLSMGADPGGLINFGRMKNPLSPLWKVCVMSEEDPLSLRQWTDIVDIECLFVGLERDYNTIRAVRDGADETMSNSAFNELRRAAFFKVLSWYRGDDPRFSANRDTVAGHLVKELGSQARHTLLYGNKPRAAMAILVRVAAFVAERFDTEKADKGAYKPNAGILAETLPEDMSGKARMSAGGKYAREQSLDKTVATMVSAAKALMKSGLDMSKSEIIKRSGASRATVFRRWDDMIEALKVESHKGASKKAGTIQASSKNTSLSSGHTVPPSQMNTQSDRPVSISNDNLDHGLTSCLEYHSGCPVDIINETDFFNPEADHFISEAA